MIVESAITYVMAASIFFADGSQMDAYGDNFPTYEACYMQAEADLKIMAREVENIEAGLASEGKTEKVVQEIRVICEPMGGDTTDPLSPVWEARYVR